MGLVQKRHMFKNFMYFYLFYAFIFYSTIFIATNVPRVFITFVEGMHNMRFLFFYTQCMHSFKLSLCAFMNCFFCIFTIN